MTLSELREVVFGGCAVAGHWGECGLGWAGPRIWGDGFAVAEQGFWGLDGATILNISVASILFLLYSGLLSLKPVSSSLHYTMSSGKCKCSIK